MARIRSVKPEYWSDYRLAKELPRDVRLFYIALWNEADDEGRFQAHPRRVLGACFPYDDDLSAEDIEQWMILLSDTGRLVLYTVDGEPYGQLTKFGPHQRINRPTPSRLPAPPEPSPDPNGNSSRSPHGGLSEDFSPRARAPELDLELGARSKEQDPPGVAHVREPIEPERGAPRQELGHGPPPAPDEEPLPEVPADRGARVIPLRPPPIDELPFRNQDWHGRLSGAQVLAAWIALQPTPPSRPVRDRYGGTCKRIADNHSTGEIALAFIGMGHLWPYAPPPIGKSQPWTPEHLWNRFAEAVPAAALHPDFKKQSEAADFDEAFARAKSTGGPFR